MTRSTLERRLPTRSQSGRGAPQREKEKSGLTNEISQRHPSARHQYQTRQIKQSPCGSPGVFNKPRRQIADSNGDRSLRRLERSVAHSFHRRPAREHDCSKGHGAPQIYPHCLARPTTNVKRIKSVLRPLLQAAISKCHRRLDLGFS